jgi:asparaginyl-tRNA synthetase
MPSDDVQPSSAAEAAQGPSHCYIDADKGVDDQSADGSELQPFKSLAYAYIQNIAVPTKQYLVRAPADSPDSAGKHVWKEPAKSAVKKAQGVLARHKEKVEKQRIADEEKQQKRQLTLQQAKSVVVKEDPSLPKAVQMKISRKDVELGEGTKKGTRVKVFGRIHRLRAQKHATFITLVDGYGQLQCVLEAGNLTKSYDALQFAQGTALAVYGEMKKVPEGHSAPGGSLYIEIVVANRVRRSRTLGRLLRSSWPCPFRY